MQTYMIYFERLMEMTIEADSEEAALAAGEKAAQLYYGNFAAAEAQEGDTDD